MVEKDLLFLDEFLCNLSKINEQIVSFLSLKKQLNSEKDSGFLLKINEPRKKAKKILLKFKNSFELNELLKKHNLTYEQAFDLFKEFDSEMHARNELKK